MHILRPLSLKQFSNLIKSYKSSKFYSNKKLQNYVIVRPTLSEYENVLELMHKSYYLEEPTTSAVGLKPCAVFDDRVIQNLSKGYSLVAKCKYNGNILGAAINEITHCWDPNILDKLACEVKCVKLKKLLHFYAYLGRAPDLWRKYNVHNIFEISYVFVSKNARRKGMARKLMENSRQSAACSKFSLLRVDATSAYTAKLCEAMNMKMVYEIPYCSYVGENQKPIFNPPDPHKSVKVYVDDNLKKM